MANINSFMTGRQAKLTLFTQGDKAPPFLCDSWNVGQDADAFSDGVCGEDRDRLGKEIKSYTFSAAIFVPDLEMTLRILKYDIALDSDEAPSCEFGLILTPPGGTSALFTMTEGSLDNWKLSAGGRTARIKIDVPMRFRYFKKV